MFTWIVWAVVTILAFFAQWQKGGGAGSWTTGVTGIITIFIAIVSLWKGSKDITKLDIYIFIGALLAIIPWVLTKDPTLSAVILTIIDAFAFIPTIRKTAKSPESETFVSYILHLMRHSLSIFALANYNLATYLYPATLALMNLIVILVIVRTKKNREFLLHKNRR